MATRNPPSKFESGVSEYADGLRVYLRCRLGNVEEAEDALQEILYNLFRTAGDELTDIVNLPAWLYRSARNLLSNLGRRPAMSSMSDDDILFDILADDASPESEMLKTLFWDELDKTLSELPEDQRLVWTMTELEGVPVKEIVRLTGVPQATLLSRKHYAVKHLRKRLQDLYNEIINQ